MISDIGGMEFIDLSNQAALVNEFLVDKPEANIFQSPEYAQLQVSVSNQKPFCFGVQRDEELLGLVSGIIITNYSWPVSLLTSRAIISGGPVLKDPNSLVLGFLLEHLAKALGKQVIFTQIRNLKEWSAFKPTFEQYGFSYVPHLDILIDLEQPEVKLLSRISKNKRKNVRKTLNKGCTFEVITDKTVYQDAIALVLDTYKRAKVPSPDPSLLQVAFDQLRKDKKFVAFGIFHEGLLIGTRMELLYNGLVYDWYAGSHHQYTNKYPNDFLIYHLLLWAKGEGYHTFDFGGAGKPGIPYGVRDYKMKFGGELVEYGRFDKVHNTYLYALGKLGLKAFQLFK